MTWFLIVIVGLILLWAIVIFNRLIVLRNRCRNSRSQIEVALKRRHDLIPKLVQVVKGYAGHEQETLTRVTAARSIAMDASSLPQRSAAESELTSFLRNLKGVVEAYPDLKANEDYLELQDELAETEDKIRFTRQFYNDIVMRYNIYLQTFPNILLARPLGFREQPFFDLADTPDQRQTPRI